MAKISPHGRPNFASDGCQSSSESLTQNGDDAEDENKNNESLPPPKQKQYKAGQAPIEVPHYQASPEMPYGKLTRKTDVYHPDQFKQQQRSGGDK